MRRRRGRFIGFVGMAMFVLFLASTALAGPWAGGHGMGPGWSGPGYGQSNLKLSPEQSAQLEEMRQNYLQEITPLQNQMMRLRSEMQILWKEAAPDREKIQAKQKEMFELRKQIEEKAIQYRLDCRGVLTPEQQSQLSSSGPGIPWGHGQGWRHMGRW